MNLNVEDDFLLIVELIQSDKQTFLELHLKTSQQLSHIALFNSLRNFWSDKKRFSMLSFNTRALDSTSIFFPTQIIAKLK